MKEIWKVAAPGSFILTTATWLVFRYSEASSTLPLNKLETTFVFAFWFGVLALVVWISKRLRRKPGGN